MKITTSMYFVLFPYLFGILLRFAGTPPINWDMKQSIREPLGGDGRSTSAKRKVAEGCGGYVFSVFYDISVVFTDA